MRLARSWTSTSSSTTSAWAVTVRLARLVTISTPLRSRIRPRGAWVYTVLVLLDSARSAYSSEETSCMDQSLAKSVAKMAPTATERPTSLEERVFSVDESDPPDARGAEPPMSNVKAASPRP